MLSTRMIRTRLNPRVQLIAWMLLFLGALQFGLGYLIPATWIYHYRVDFETVKADLSLGMRRAIELIAREVRQAPEREYLLLLGDSIAYSGPGAPTQSIAYYLEQWGRGATSEDDASLAPQEVAPRKRHGRPWRVYNLGEPAMKAGDLYALLLMLRQHGVPLTNLVINLTYFQFSPHPAGESWVRWLGQELKRLDPAAWQEARGFENPALPLGERLAQTLLGPLSLYQYRDLLRSRLLRLTGLHQGQEVHDLRPWTEKAHLRSLMLEPIYQRFVAPEPFTMDGSNPAALLWRRILDLTQGANLLLFFSPVNQGLMTPWVKAPGYQANLARIDQFFAPLGDRYINWERTLSSDQFIDHVHLTPTGYRALAERIGQALLRGAAGAGRPVWPAGRRGRWRRAASR